MYQTATPRHPWMDFVFFPPQKKTEASNAAKELCKQQLALCVIGGDGEILDCTGVAWSQRWIRWKRFWLIYVWYPYYCTYLYMSSYLCVHACIDLFFPGGNGMFVYTCILMFRLMMIDVHSHKRVSNTHEKGIPKKTILGAVFFHIYRAWCFFQIKSWPASQEESQ